MKRLIFLNRFFFPDHSATSQLLSDLAFHLVAAGIEVHVITSQQRYDRPGARLMAEEIVQGVHVHRISTTHFGRSGLLGRGIDYFSYYASMRRSLLDLATRDDTIVAMTDPPLISIIAMRAARRRQAHLVNWLQDIYPEVAIQLGVPFLRGPAGRSISYFRDRSLHAAAANVVVGHRMGELIISRGISADDVHVIPNWTDDAEIAPICHADNPLRREWDLEDKFVVGYSGNLGRAHDIETVLAASQRIKDHPRIVFLCVGGGHRFEELATRVREYGLERMFRFLPYQDRTLLVNSLGVADVHWISLKPELEGLVVPSKFYGVASAGRPVIAISAKGGEIARFVEQYACGVVVEPGNGQAFATTLLRLSKDPRRVEEMGKRARGMLEELFTRQKALERWRDVLDAIE